MGYWEGTDVRRDRGMSTQHTTQPLSDERLTTAETNVDATAQDMDALADVIAMPNVDAPSWYQRNSGALPKSDAGMADTHRRTQLPKPENDDSDPLMDRIRSIFKR